MLRPDLRCKPFWNRPTILAISVKEAAMKVADLIASRKEVYTILEDTTVYDAARFLREKRVRAVAIQSQQGKLVGVVSQSDVTEKVAAENKCPAWMRASEIMSTRLVTIAPEAKLEECLGLNGGASHFSLARRGRTG
jgi:CBS domain-containing protein